MKTINYFILRGVIALVIGILLVVWPEDAIRYLVITIGILFLIPGVIAIVNYFTRKKSSTVKSYFPVLGLGSLLFGLWLMITPDFFVTILMYVLGFILVLGGIQQIVSLSQTRKRFKVSLGYYVIPVLVLIAGIIVLFNPFEVASAAFILLGITCIVYGVSELMDGILLHKKIGEGDTLTPIE